MLINFGGKEKNESFDLDNFSDLDNGMRALYKGGMNETIAYLFGCLKRHKGNVYLKYILKKSYSYISRHY